VQTVIVMRPSILILPAAGLMVCACGGGALPTSPTPIESKLVIDATTPASGSTIVVPEQYPYIVPGGVVIPRDSGLISVRVTMTSSHDVPWVRLGVYLLKSGTSHPRDAAHAKQRPHRAFAAERDDRRGDAGAEPADSTLTRERG
jgi:hypothetical protein